MTRSTRRATGPDPQPPASERLPDAEPAGAAAESGPGQRHDYGHEYGHDDGPGHAHGSDQGLDQDPDGAATGAATGATTRQVPQPGTGASAVPATTPPQRGAPAEPGAPTTAPRQRPARPDSPRRTTRSLVAADCVAVLAGTGVAGAGAGSGAGAVRCGALALGVLLVACRQAGLYRPGFDPRALPEVPSIGARAMLAWGFAVALLGAGTSRDALVGAVAATVAVACGLRALTYRRRRADARRHPRSTLVVGVDTASARIAATLRAHPEYGLRPVGVIAPGPAAEPVAPPVRDPAGPLPEPPLPVLAGQGEITRALIQNSVRHAVVAAPIPSDPPTTAALRLLAAHGCQVWQLGPARGPVPSGHLWGFAAHPVDSDPERMPGLPGRWAKRALDAAVSGTALLCLSPVLAGCALAVRLGDGPGVIFRQQRIGLGGRPFTILKFRTLRPSGEHESATRWNIAHDGQMTRVGRLLRRTSLDELPQLWNVLRGDMSLVGPRPERPHFVERFGTEHPGYRDRHRMPAGITGLAQVHGLRGDTSIADRARFDNHYIDSWSLWSDVALLLRTAFSVFRFGGS